MRVDNDVLTVLQAAELDGPCLRITEQLAPAMYAKVKKVLEAMGGKWTRSLNATCFDGDAADIMDPVIQTGEYSRVKQDLGQFDSTPAVVARVLELAGDLTGLWVLEPSAGVGNIVKAAKAAGAHVWAYELDEKRAHALEAIGVANAPGENVWCDFMDIRAGEEPGFDVVLMNPPFAGQADIEHVLHAATFLRNTGGRLVAVMSNSVTFRTNRKTLDFRAWVTANGGSIEELPEGAFAASGTMVRACIVSVTL